VAVDLPSIFNLQEIMVRRWIEIIRSNPSVSREVATSLVEGVAMVVKSLGPTTTTKMKRFPH
jgi:hypothetical protein